MAGTKVLDLFHPAVAEWFGRAFPVPTRPQQLGWPAIARGDSTLILAPTGGGWGSSTYRVFAKHVARSSQAMSNGASAMDARSRSQAGFRLDAGSPESGAWMVKTDVLSSTNDFPDRADGEFTMADVQARYTKALSPQSQLQLQSHIPAFLYCAHHAAFTAIP